MDNQEHVKEPYIGSVLFYKHLILSVVALMIVTAITLCVILCFANSKISDEISKADNEIELLEGELLLIQKEEENEIVNEAASKQDIVEKTEEWQKVFVSDNSSIVRNFQVELITVANGEKVDKRIEIPLKNMLEAMEAEGMEPIVYSGYRSIEEQTVLFEEAIALKLREGKEYTQAFFETKQRIAHPGSSEHHTGLAVDITGKNVKNLDVSLETTAELEWLAAHCAEYGFILRYPKDKKEITGVDYHPWHFRYVGVEAARYMMENDLTLEEFLYDL